MGPMPMTLADSERAPPCTARRWWLCRLLRWLVLRASRLILVGPGDGRELRLIRKSSGLLIDKCLESVGHIERWGYRGLRRSTRRCLRMTLRWS